MPKLPDTYIKFQSEDHSYRKYHQCKTYVDSEGNFTLHIPEELEEPADAIFKSQWGMVKEQFGVVQVENQYKQRKWNWVVKSKTLAAAKKFLEYVLAEQSKCKVDTALVIAYEASLSMSFWLNKDGTVAGHGVNKDGKWWGAKNNNGPASWEKETGSIGIQAAVFRQKTFHRTTGKSVTYEKLHDDDAEVDIYITELNSFRSDLHPDREDNITRTMPYTPDAAMFFTRMITALCHLAIQLDEFFGDPKTLQKAIKAGSTLALTDSKGPQLRKLRS
jgi:hypothetical protein